MCHTQAQSLRIQCDQPQSARGLTIHPGLMRQESVITHGVDGQRVSCYMPVLGVGTVRSPPLTCVYNQVASCDYKAISA